MRTTAIWFGLVMMGVMGVTVAVESTVPSPVKRTVSAAQAPAPVSTADKPFSSIDADNGDYDYEKRVAIFEGHVIAVDPQLKLICGKMVVSFDEKSNEVLRVEAFSDVHMFNEGKEAIGEKAVFTRETGIIVLSGTNARLRDEKGSWVESRGAGIIYNINTKQMKVDKPRLMILPGGSGLSEGAKPSQDTPKP